METFLSRKLPVRSQDIFQHSLLLDQRMREKRGIALHSPKVMEKALQNTFYHVPECGLNNDHDIIAITLTLNPNMIVSFDNNHTRVDSIDPDDLRKLIETKILEHLYLSKYPIDILLYFEFTKNFDLHMHGCILAYKTNAARFLKWYKRKFGFYKVSNLTDLDGWLEYCHKDQNESCLEPLCIKKIRKP